jgi:hypothetical protein
MSYESFLCEPGEVNELLQEVNEKDQEVVAVTYVTDGQQVLIVCKQRERKPYLNSWKRKEEEETEEE